MKTTVTNNSSGYSLLIQSNENGIKSREVYLFLHGVPSIGCKNEDIAYAVTADTKQDSIVIHYSGLGEAKGENNSLQFDFIDSVSEAMDFAKSLIGIYERINLVGHSWGACIALNIFRTILKDSSRGQVILLAPFSEFPEDHASVGSWLVPMAKDGRIPLKVGAEGAVENFFVVEQMYPPKSNIDELNSFDNQFTVIEAIEDPDLPNASTARLVRDLHAGKNSVQYYRLEDDHLFSTNRKNIILTVLGAIKSYSPLCVKTAITAAVPEFDCDTQDNLKKKSSERDNEIKAGEQETKKIADVIIEYVFPKYRL